MLQKNIYSNASNPTKTPEGELHVPDMGEIPGNAAWGFQVPTEENQHRAGTGQGFKAEAARGPDDVKNTLEIIRNKP